MELINSNNTDTKMIGLELLNDDKELFIAVLAKLDSEFYFKAQSEPKILEKLKELEQTHVYETTK